MYANLLTKRLFRAFKLQSYCCLCHETDSAGGICTDCESLLPQNKACCERCALPGSTPLQTSVDTYVCTECILSPPPYRSAIVPYRYAFPVDFILHELKYRNRLEMGKGAGELLARHVNRTYARAGVLPDAVVPVPLSAARMEQRGFNQSYELARWCSRSTRIPLDHRLVWRTRNTASQSGLDREQRLSNLHQAFAARERVQGMHILLVDDVMTTGATFIQLANCLISAGAAEVDVCAFARTVYDASA